MEFGFAAGAAIGNRHLVVAEDSEGSGADLFLFRSHLVAERLHLGPVQTFSVGGLQGLTGREQKERELAVLITAAPSFSGCDRLTGGSGGKSVYGWL